MHIFNFHNIEPKPFSHSERQAITITPEGMLRFIRMVRLLGMEIVSLKDVLETGLHREHASRHARKLIITFDDGCENFYTYGFPVFEKEQCPVTMFVLANKFSGSNDWDQGHLPIPQRDRLMSLDQIKTLTKSKYVTIGSHGLNHCKFAELPPDILHEEIHESYKILYGHLGKDFLPVMAYPWGNYNDTVCQAMENSPYEYAVTTDKGQWSNYSRAYQIPRYTAYYRDGDPVLLLTKFLRYKIGYFDAFDFHSALGKQKALPI